MHRRSMTVSMACERKYVFLISLYPVAFVTVVVSLAVGIPADAHFTAFTRPLLVAANALSTSRTLYAVNQSSATRGSIAVYDIDRKLLRQFRRSQMWTTSRAWRLVPLQANSMSPTGLAQESE